MGLRARILALAGSLSLGLLAGVGVALAGSYTHRYDAAIREASELFMPELPSWQLWKAQLLSESLLDPNATSPVGAQGVAQFMPRTWREVSRDLMFPESATPYMAEYAIQAGAYYMMKQRRAWRDLKDLDRHKFAAASYNAGLGNVRKAHDLCVVGKTIWLYVADCLAQVTGPANARETTRYIAKILGTWKFQLEAEE